MTTIIRLVALTVILILMVAIIAFVGIYLATYPPTS